MRTPPRRADPGDSAQPPFQTQAASAPACRLRHPRDNGGVPDDVLSLPAERLTAHQPPALLVERVVSLAEGGGRVRLKAHQGLDAFQLLEACAQAVAVLMGARMRRDGIGRAASGMLVGAKAFTTTRAALAGEAVEVDARVAVELGPLQLHAVSARSVDMDVEIASGELKVAATGGA